MVDKIYQRQIIHNFLFFLKEKDVYPQFLIYTYLFHSCCGMNLYSYVLEKIDCCPEHLIIGAFNWDNTKEQASFWSKLHSQWYDICRKHGYL